MTKRSVEDYAPIGLGRMLQGRSADKAVVAELIARASPLPHKRFRTLVAPRGGELRERSLTAKAIFILSMERAATAFFLEREDRTRPNPIQLAREFETIERAASRLLQALQCGLAGDIENMPYALRFDGLERQAEIEESEAYRSSKDRPMPTTRVRHAVGGVAELRRWARAAKLEARMDSQPVGVLQEWPHQATQAGMDVSPTVARHDGDAALNGFLMRVLRECWLGIAGKPITDSSKPAAFVKLAAKAVGVDLKGSGRDRLRGILKAMGESDSSLSDTPVS